jgi:hypothetical protein
VSEDSEAPEQRMKRFRGLAAKARVSSAKSSSPVDRNEFLRIANEWEEMANMVNPNPEAPAVK